MTDKNLKVFIKAMGIISPLGNSPDVFYKNYTKKNIIRQIKKQVLINKSECTSKEIGKKQLINNFDRITLLNLAAAENCLGKENNKDNFGIMLGTTYGCLDSLLTSEETFLTKGFLAYNPALFPNTVYNAVASQINIHFQNNSFSEVICTNRISGLVAIGEAYEKIKAGFPEDILAGGYDEISDHVPLAVYLENLPETKQAADNNLGEGSGLFLLGSKDSRNYKYSAEIIGYGFSYAEKSRDEDSLELLEETLKKSGLAKKDILYIFSNNGSDKENQIYERCFAEHYKNLEIINLKSLIGESFSAHGAFQLALAIKYLAKNKNKNSGHCLISGLENEDYNCCLIIKKAE